MIESLLRVQNFYWADARFRPPLDLDGVTPGGRPLVDLRGQFSFALRGPKTRLVLARDPLGINKLFFAIHDSTVSIANYLVDLVDRNVPFETIYSVPSGHVVEIDVERGTLTLRRYFDLDARARQGEASRDRAARTIRQHLEVWFSRLAEQFRHRRIFVCLSGGLDSSLIAALAAKYFPDVTAYTYGFFESDERESEDVRYARQVAELLALPLRLVRATADDVLAVVADALCYGQDWRAFNVHCAIVNEILARAIERGVREGASREPVLVLTGDLANELLADYTPLSYAGEEVYRVPRVGPACLRTALLHGLDAGDREVGIFGHHGIDVIQPYGLLIDQYLALPASMIGHPNFKQLLVREMAGDLLPSFLFERRKARAQIGDPDGPGGLLSTLLRAGCDSGWLRRAFCHRFMVKEETILNGFIRLGRYRFLNEFPHRRHESHGSVAREHRVGG